MTMRTLSAAVGLAATLVSGIRAGAAALPEAVTVAVTQVVAGEVAAWNRGDAAAFAAPATEDVAFTNIVGMHTIGKIPFEAQHARIFAGIYKGSTMAQQVEHIALVRADVAIVDTLTSVTDAAALPPGVEAGDGVLRTRLEQVMVREGGVWRVASFHNVVVNAKAIAAVSR